jgi:hypothetical protein
MKHLKTFEQFNTVEYTDYELSEKMALFGGDPEKKKAEIKTMADTLKLEEKAPTLAKFISQVLEKDKLTPSRLAEVLKRVFGGDEYYKKYSWLANKDKYAKFKEVADKAMSTNKDEDWQKAISLINFGMKFATSVAAFPIWDEKKKEWNTGSKSGAVGL